MRPEVPKRMQIMRQFGCSSIRGYVDLHLILNMRQIKQQSLITFRVVGHNRYVCANCQNHLAGIHTNVLM